MSPVMPAVVSLTETFRLGFPCGIVAVNCGLVTVALLNWELFTETL